MQVVLERREKAAEREENESKVSYLASDAAHTLNVPGLGQLNGFSPV